MSAAAPHPLELNDITVTFRSREEREQRYTAVAGTTLKVAAGEFVSVVGPTGCGKSTLLNVGAGLLPASSGEVRVFGEPLAGINRRAGYMFQSDALMPWRSAIANVMVGLQYRGLPDAEARAQAQAWLDRVGLAGFEDRYPHQLSGGMRKRTALAQTLALDPDIILMDEPFSALDIQTRQLMENEVLELWAAKKKAVLFITHDLDEAIAMSDRVVVLSAGPATHPIGEFAVDLPRPQPLRLDAKIGERNREPFGVPDTAKRRAKRRIADTGVASCQARRHSLDQRGIERRRGHNATASGQSAG